MVQDIDLTGKTALVTGASRGIGAAVAKGLAGAGAHVVLLARTVGGLEEVDDAIQALTDPGAGSATLMPVDLMKLDDIDKLGPALQERFDGLDIFIGNAGMLGPQTPVHQIKPKDWDKVMTLNFAANLRLIRTLDPLLRAAPAGRAVFTTSGAAGRFDAYRGPYAASKAALETAVKTYAAETQQTHMKVNLVSPGFVDTKLLEEAYPGGYQGGMKKPEDVVETYLGLCSEGCAQHGEVVAV